MKVVVTGASGNVGTALLRRLHAADEVSWITGVARRLPDRHQEPYAAVEWRAIDVGDADSVGPLADAMTGAGAVVHLAWLIQPSRDEAAMRRTNVDGTRHVVTAALRAGVPHLVVASSVGAYGPGPKDRRVDERWTTSGTPSSAYSRDKVAVERYLDDVVAGNPALTVARLRPGLVFQRGAGSEIARYFLGPLVPVGLLSRLRLPVVPLSDRLVFQAVHADDLADAYWRVVAARAGGAFNAAAEPVLGPRELAAALGGRPVRVTLNVLRAMAALTWRLHLQPTAPGWVDLAGGVPLMDTHRLRDELGWSPSHGADEALVELVTGMAAGAGEPSAPLHPRT